MKRQQTAPNIPQDSQQAFGHRQYVRLVVLGVTVCMSLFTFSAFGYLLQCITLEISSPALLDVVCVELEDGQNVKE